MKVFQINCSAQGSTGKIARSIHNTALEQGIESCFAYGTGVCGEKNSFQISNQFDFRIHTYVSRVTGLHGYYSTAKTRRLIAEIDKRSPDIIHLHNLHGGYLNIGLLLDYLKKTDKRIVLTLHDCWLFTGGCPHFTVAGCEKWLDECGKCPQLNIYPKSLLFDTSKKCLADKKIWLSGFDKMRIVAVSHWLRRQASRSFLGGYPIETIYNGIDVNVFQPIMSDSRAKYNIQQENPIIMGAANVWDKRKRLDLFLKLNEELKNEVTVVLVGLSSQQIAELPVGIVGIERTASQTDLVVLYSEADLFINFSAEETFGMVTAEAMACGTPVLVSNSTACPEIVDSNTGYVVDVDDFEQVIRVIRTHLQSRKDMKQACIERVQENFKDTDMAQQYINLYHSMMDDI